MVSKIYGQVQNDPQHMAFTETITGRIANGELKPGQVIRQGALAAELEVTRHYVQTAIEQLIAAGTLRYSDATSAYARRAVVCWPLEQPPAGLP